MPTIRSLRVVATALLLVVLSGASAHEGRDLSAALQANLVDSSPAGTP